MFAHQGVQASLAVGSQVDIFLLIASEALVSPSIRVLEENEGWAGEAVHVHLIGDQSGGGTDKIIVSKFHVWQMGIPIILPLADDHSEHLSHGMIYALDAVVAVRMIGTCPNFSRAEELVHSVRQLGAELEAVVRENTNGASP